MHFKYIQIQQINLAIMPLVEQIPFLLKGLNVLLLAHSFRQMHSNVANDYNYY